MIDLEDFTAVDFLPGGRYFVGLAGDDDRFSRSPSPEIRQPTSRRDSAWSGEAC